MKHVDRTAVGAAESERWSETVNDNAKKSSKKGYVYFLRAQRTGRIKIGKTTNINKRVRDLRHANADDLDLYSHFETNDRGRSESILHQQFRYCRTKNGEWFEHDERLMGLARILNGRNLLDDSPIIYMTKENKDIETRNEASSASPEIEKCVPFIGNVSFLDVFGCFERDFPDVLKRMKPVYVPCSVRPSEVAVDVSIVERCDEFSWEAYEQSDFVSRTRLEWHVERLSAGCHEPSIFADHFNRSGIKCTAAMFSVAEPSRMDQLAVLMSALLRSSKGDMHYDWRPGSNSLYFGVLSLAEDYLLTRRKFDGFRWHQACRVVLPGNFYFEKIEPIDIGSMVKLLAHAAREVWENSVLVRLAPFCRLDSKPTEAP